MASSGWQAEQFATNSCFSSYVKWNVNLYVQSISHVGTNLTITGRIAWCTRQKDGTSGGGSTTFGYPCYVTPQGGSQYTVVNASVRQSVGSDYYAPSSSTFFTVTIPNVAATATSYTYSCAWSAPGNSTGSYGGTTGGTVYWTLSFDQSGTAPSGLDVTLTSVQDTGATMAVTLSSYGTPSSEAGRYIEADIFSTNAFASPYRYDIATATNSATITVNNSSRTNTSNPLTIVPNTQYWYGAYATNTVMTTSIVKGGFITLPAYITSITANDVGQGEVYFTVNHASEGTADTVITELSYDQTTWQTVSDNFHLTLTGQTTLYVRRTNSSGSTPVYSISVVPSTRIKLYGSVNSQAKEIRKLYGSVNGEAVRIRKLYGSVNGRSKLIFVDNSGTWLSRGSGTAGDPYVISSSYGDTIS